MVVRETGASEIEAAEAEVADASKTSATLTGEARLTRVREGEAPLGDAGVSYPSRGRLVSREGPASALTEPLTGRDMVIDMSAAPFEEGGIYALVWAGL